MKIERGLEYHGKETKLFCEDYHEEKFRKEGHGKKISCFRSMVMKFCLEMQKMTVLYHEK